MSDTLSEVEQALAPFNTVTAVIVQPILNLTVMLYVFGVYTVLFIISLRILLRRRDHQNRALYIFFTIALFTLTGAVNLVVTLILTRQATLEFKFSKNRDWRSWAAYLEHDTIVGTIETGLQTILPVCLMTMADLMLLHRCYVIWGYSKRIAFPFIFFIVSFTICYFVGATFTIISVTNYATNLKLYIKGTLMKEAYWFASIGINTTLTLLTTGRIWWVSRGSESHVAPEIKTKYNTIAAIILESGALYPITLVAAILVEIFADPDSHHTQPLSPWIVTYQLAGIAPTLVIIRTVGGKVGHTSSNQVFSSLHCVEGARLGSSGTILPRIEDHDGSQSSMERRKSSGGEIAA